MIIDQRQSNIVQMVAIFSLDFNDISAILLYMKMIAVRISLNLLVNSVIRLNPDPDYVNFFNGVIL